tara:strand:+ start:186 stop:1130 length:945 start_codon:yes stop_codon:yes gene_type:complete
MGFAKEVVELGVKKIAPAVKKFVKENLSEVNAGIFSDMAKHNPQAFNDMVQKLDTITKTKDQVLREDLGVTVLQDFDKIKADRQRLQTAREVQSTLNNQYTRPDAIENLGKLGGQTKWGKTQRTIQGPVPPNLSDKTFAQGAKTQEEAIMAGTTKFIKDGDPFQIRNYAAGYAPKGQTTKVGTRKTTGRGITKEGNTRKINEALATDPNITPEEKKEFARIMAEAAAKGMDGDHIIEVSRVANAVRDMSPERRAAYFEVMRRTNTPTGNHPKNIQILSKEMNQVVKPAEIRALDNALRKMDKRGKSLLEELLDI